MAKAATGVLLNGLRGSAGNVTFVSGPTGTVLRLRSTPRDPQTRSQIEARRRMSVAMTAWRTMSVSQAQAWRLYAELVGERPARAHLLFCQLATRFLALHPSGVIPLNPPSSAFTGDAVTIAVSGIGGAVRYSSDGPNHSGVTTELLLQPLESPHRRTYDEKYRTQVFVAFGDMLSFDVSVAPGFYACAVRFLRAATGQESGLVQLGVVQVF